MSAPRATLGIAGHAGIGHTHCPGGLIQDDTAGFAVAAAIIRDEVKADTHVATIEAGPDDGIIRVTTAGGGTGQSSPRRGITPAEARMMRDAVGRDALFCQTVPLEVLGRMYGQGVRETPVGLAAALANAVIDTFRKKAPDRFFLTMESVPTNSGLIGGMSLELGSIKTSVMAAVNASSSGIGPNEDLEGNVALGSRGEVMRKLGMLRCPTIVLEGKAYSPARSDGLRQPAFLVRCQRDIDNIVVAEAWRDSARDLGLPVIFVEDAFPRNPGLLRRKTAEVADSIAKAAENLKRAETGSDKVLVAAELARLISQEVGGVSFMTNGVHDVVRQVGLIPGTSAVLSMLVTKEYLAHWKIPLLEQEDVDRMKSIVLGAMRRIASRLDRANEVLDRLYEDLAPLEPLLG